MIFFLSSSSKSFPLPDFDPILDFGMVERNKLSSSSSEQRERETSSVLRDACMYGVVLKSAGKT